VLRLRDLLNEEGYRARELFVETRNLAETLLKVIEDEQIHLIVMSMQGRTEMLRWIFGATVEKALNTLPVPVLLARPVYSTIVIPIDGSSWSESAIPKAVEMARNHNAELVLLHVFQSPTSSYDSQLALAGQQDMVDQSYTEIHDHLIAIRNMLRKEGLRVREHIIRGSNPAQAICDYTDTVEGMCMIVMSTHGRTGLSRWLVGSVAQRVIKNANCPVTLVHQGSGD
jgi:nucleotide-binding universal stress UspA family protein